MKLNIGSFLLGCSALVTMTMMMPLSFVSADMDLVVRYFPPTGANATAGSGRLLEDENDEAGNKVNDIVRMLQSTNNGYNTIKAQCDAIGKIEFWSTYLFNRLFCVSPWELSMGAHRVPPILTTVFLI
jgi:hypothetical protein